MRTFLLAGAIRDEWRKHIKIDIDIQANRVVNKVTGEVAGLPSTGLSFSTDGQDNVAVFTAASFGGITFAHDANLAPGAGDFTIEAIFDVDSIPVQTADNSQIVPICMWGTWGAPGQTMNLDALYNHLTGGGMQMGQYKNNAGTYITKTGMGQVDMTKYVHFVFQRKNGVGYLYYNGTLVQSGTFIPNLDAAGVGPFRIMSRRGGGAGDVFWRFVGKLKGFRFTHAAVYSGGQTITALDRF